MKTFKFISKSEEETKGFASKFARVLRPNDCLALVGEFGSGKTTFVKGLVRGFGFRKKNYVCSPSFVLLKIYRGRLPVYHFDLYRLNSPKDVEGIGLTEFLEAGGVSVIEGADKIKNFLPSEHLKIKFSILGPRKRSVVFFTTTLRLKRFLKRMVA